MPMLARVSGISRTAGFGALINGALLVGALIVNQAAHTTIVGLEVLLILCAVSGGLGLAWWLNLVVRAAITDVVREMRNADYLDGVNDAVKRLGDMNENIKPIQRRDIRSQHQG